MSDDVSGDARTNRRYWDRFADEYQERHGFQLNHNELCWGVWATPESELKVLGDVAGKDILELGCGGAQWSIFCGDVLFLAVLAFRPQGIFVAREARA